MHDPHDRAHHDDLLVDDGAATPAADRRDGGSAHDPVHLRTGLSPAQRETVELMEDFRWRLAFVRQPASAAPIAILLNRDGTRYLVVNDDGRIDVQPALTLRT